MQSRDVMSLRCHATQYRSHEGQSTPCQMYDLRCAVTHLPPLGESGRVAADTRAGVINIGDALPHWLRGAVRCGPMSRFGSVDVESGCAHLSAPPGEPAPSSTRAAWGDQRHSATARYRRPSPPRPARDAVSVEAAHTYTARRLRGEPGFGRRTARLPSVGAQVTAGRDAHMLSFELAF